MQLETVGRTTFSMEQIAEHDADIVLTASFAGEGWDPGIDSALAQPVAQSLDAVRRDEFHVFDGIATVGVAFEKMHNFVDYLRSILVDREPRLTRLPDHGGVETLRPLTT
ncbi:MAG: hypothetical protein GEU80_17260 [Dehalococcoidia bacterium]|nr:hypothetical protein [Dehalococcoidia bacterium]